MSLLRLFNPAGLSPSRASVSLGMPESDESCPDIQVSFKINFDYQIHPESSSPDSISWAYFQIPARNPSQLM